MNAPVFSPHSFRCSVCFRRAYATVAAIQQTRESAMLGEEVSDAEIAAQFEFCGGCADGDPRPEGYVSQARMVAVGGVDRGGDTVALETTLSTERACLPSVDYRIMGYENMDDVHCVAFAVFPLRLPVPLPPVSSEPA